MSRILYFGCNDMDEMLAKGNVWYVQQYETLFNGVVVAYLYSSSNRSITRNRTTLISFATRGPKLLNLFFAPFRLLSIVNKIDFSVFLSADILFSWWAFLLVRVIKRKKYILMPVCIPDDLYRNRKKTLIGLPYWLERILVSLSFIFSSSIITGPAFGDAYRKWLSSFKFSKNKLCVLPVLPEALLSASFLKNLQSIFDNPATKRCKNTFVMLYVGGLREEKLVDHLVYMLRFLLDQEGSDMPYRLRLAGDGPFRNFLIELAISLGVDGFIEFLGTVENGRLPEEYVCADVFLSPLTGTSLREAALCGTPTVAYNIDWAADLFVHRENILFAERGDYEKLGESVILLRKDEMLRKKLSSNIRKVAESTFLMSPLHGDFVKNKMIDLCL